MDDNSGRKRLVTYAEKKSNNLVYWDNVGI